MPNEKNLEQRLRYALANMGYRLHKSRARNWTCDNQQGYMIVDNYCNGIVCGARFDMSLEDVADFVKA